MKGLANWAHDVGMLIDEWSQANEGLQVRIVELEKRIPWTTKDAPIAKTIGLLGVDQMLCTRSYPQDDSPHYATDSLLRSTCGKNNNVVSEMAQVTGAQMQSSATHRVIDDHEVVCTTADIVGDDKFLDALDDDEILELALCPEAAIHLQEMKDQLIAVSNELLDNATKLSPQDCENLRQKRFVLV
ncbi:hypothetical protein BHE74_00015710 [Ensete ventricosum]|nr:hypothetical protein BHE74_00015710 [Ensete ventricosum]